MKEAVTTYGDKERNDEVRMHDRTLSLQRYVKSEAVNKVMIS